MIPYLGTKIKNENHEINYFFIEEKKMKKTKEEWKKILPELSFRVTRNGETERAFTNDNFPKINGFFKCICCNEKLFHSEKKYNSGSGWPSFYQVYNNKAITEVEDLSYGMKRIEVICSKCEAHLGHLFPDGPQPTGMRYCINGAALIFEKS